MPDNSTHSRLSLKDQKLLDHAIKIISERLGDESFGTEELRHGVGLSRSQLHRKLQKITGLSTAIFIRSIRLKKAVELLKEGDLSVSEIAYRTGFSSPSYFNKCFHEQYGFPPGDIHRQKTAGSEEADLFNRREKVDKSDGGREGGFISRKLFISGIAILLILIIAAIIFVLKKPINKNKDPEKFIAVLPFKNLSDNEQNQYISDGMMEAILSNISKIGDLKVISRTSVEQYRETSKSIKQIGLELGVSHILEGSTFQDKNNLRVTVQLINTKTDEHIWSESYESPVEDVFEVQSQIARKIAGVFQSKITADEMQRIVQIPTRNTTAYDLYQKGQFYHTSFLLHSRDKDYQTGKTFFSKTIKEDTSFADAYTQLADLYWVRNYRSEYYSETFMDTVYQLCYSALELDPQSSDAHRLLGQYYFETGNREKGIIELETAISINRNNSSAYEVQGFYYNWIGKWETGIPYLLRSIQLDPYSIFLPIRYGYLARAYLDLLDFDKTFFYSQRAIDLGEGIKPALGFAYWVNAHSNLVLGKIEDALKAAEKLAGIDEIAALRIKAEIYCHLLQDFEKSVEIYRELSERDPGYFNYRHRYAYALWETGKYDSAKLLFNVQIRTFEKELELGRVERNDPHYNLAGIYAFLKDQKMAIEHLKKHRFTSGLEVYAEKDPLFKDLYENQEFKIIIQRAIEEKELLKSKIDGSIDPYSVK